MEWFEKFFFTIIFINTIMCLCGLGYAIFLFCINYF